MNMVKVDAYDFAYVMEKIGAEIGGRDVGRTHGMVQWNRNGEMVGVESWIKAGSERYFDWEITEHLHSVYLGGRDK